MVIQSHVVQYRHREVEPDNLAVLYQRNPVLPDRLPSLFRHRELHEAAQRHTQELCESDESSTIRHRVRDGLECIYIGAASAEDEQDCCHETWRQERLCDGGRLHPSIEVEPDFNDTVATNSRAASDSRLGQLRQQGKGCENPFDFREGVE